ncbi:MAG TPA: hypothetical protein VLK30_08905 [Candidatus Limnocylindrales bacterium]|nr:hypothetical protein [Candidatus Limnocylindrales bacterium]
MLPNPFRTPLSIEPWLSSWPTSAVNAGHAARSPLFDDGAFELLPIPEKHKWRPPMLRLRDVGRLARHAPAGWRDRAVHLDPDLRSTTPTYGDNCRRAGRAFSLRRAKADDAIVFFARLHPADRRAAFWFVGALMIEDVLPDVERDPGAGWWDGNAHVRRARATDTWDSFWVFKGGCGSRLFERALPLGRDRLETLLGTPLRWPSNRTDLQTIGSYTRAIRRIEGKGEEWLRSICLS